MAPRAQNWERCSWTQLPALAAAAAYFPQAKSHSTTSFPPTCLSPSCPSLTSTLNQDSTWYHLPLCLHQPAPLKSTRSEGGNWGLPGESSIVFGVIGQLGLQSPCKANILTEQDSVSIMQTPPLGSWVFWPNATHSPSLPPSDPDSLQSWVEVHLRPGEMATYWKWDQGGLTERGRSKKGDS